MSTKKATLSRESILAATSLKTEVVDVPEWGGAVTIRELTAGEAAEVGRLAADKKLNQAYWVMVSVVDESGKRIFSLHDLPGLQGLASGAVMKVATAAVKLNGLDDAEVTAKNSEASPNSDSATA
jgi:hypothetical protein